MDQQTSAALVALAKAVAEQDRPRIVALAEAIAMRGVAGLAPRDVQELQHALGAVLAEAGASNAASAAHARALQGMAAGAPDPREVLEEIDALIALSVGSGDFAKAARLQAVTVELARSVEGEDSGILRTRLAMLSQLRMRAGDAAGAAAAAAEVAAIDQQQGWQPVPKAQPSPGVASVQRKTVQAGAPAAGGARAAAAPSSAEDIALEAAAAPVSSTVATPPAIQVSPAAAGSTYQKIEVFFATSRAPTGSDNPYRAFTGRRHGDITPVHTYGIAEVSVPVRRKVGSLPTASWLNRHAGYHSEELYLLKQVRTLADAAWRERLTGRIAERPGREALVFVHGFNVEFWEAMLRAAQLAADLDIDGAVAAYSWPSRGNVLSYPSDRQEIIAPHIDELKRMVSTVAMVPGVKRVTVVAHSMGCEFLLPALEKLQLELAADRSRKGPAIKDVIFAAPDVDLAHFAGVVPKLAPLAERISVYCSEKDAALSWGRWLLMSHDRAGNQAARLSAVLAASKAPIDTIDTTAASADMVGHSDFASSALDDLRAVVWLSLLPDRRPTLEEKKEAGGSSYWIYQAANGPRQEAFREAMLLARQHGGVGPALALVQKQMTGLGEQPGNRLIHRYAAIAHALTAIG
jgi:esterase/lipase superfamily enzyme